MLLLLAGLRQSSLLKINVTRPCFKNSGFCPYFIMVFIQIFSYFSKVILPCLTCSPCMAYGPGAFPFFICGTSFRNSATVLY